MPLTGDVCSLGVLAHVDHDGEGVADDLITSQILIELFQSLTVVCRWSLLEVI